VTEGRRTRHATRATYRQGDALGTTVHPRHVLIGTEQSDGPIFLSVRLHALEPGARGISRVQTGIQPIWVSIPMSLGPELPLHSQGESVVKHRGGRVELQWCV
jgi:hypothetical protein